MGVSQVCLPIGDWRCCACVLQNDIFTWANTVFSDPDAAQYAWGTAVHWYVFPEEFDNINTTHTAWPNKGLLATEATNGGPNPGSVPSAEAYGHDIIGGQRKAT